MKKRIGFAALILDGVCFVLAIITMTSYNMCLFVVLMLLYGASMITAIICLIGDAIRFVGRMFAAGFRGEEKHYSRYCPQCGKSLEQNAHFCPGCGTKQ